MAAGERLDFDTINRAGLASLPALLRRWLPEQRMVVEHVTVNEGGQAIVGSVSHGGAGVQKKAKTTP